MPLLSLAAAPFLVVRGLAHIQMNTSAQTLSLYSGTPGNQPSEEPLEGYRKIFVQDLETALAYREFHSPKDKQGTSYRWACLLGQTPCPMRKKRAGARPEQDPLRSGPLDMGSCCPGLRAVLEVMMWLNKNIWWQKNESFGHICFSLRNIKARVMMGGGGKVLRREKNKFWRKGK